MFKNILGIFKKTQLKLNKRLNEISLLRYIKTNILLNVRERKGVYKYYVNSRSSKRNSSRIKRGSRY